MKSNRRRALLLATCAATSLFAVNLAHAQDAGDEGASEVEAIVVTGSRLPSTALNSAAPVTVLGKEEIAATGTASVGELLQQLPVASPAVSEGAGRGNNGSANVALRGLSAVNTLVLINGRRVLASTADGTVDLNSVPFEAIERVEVLQDGASAVYGADAVAGVVNLIMRRSFDGLQLNAGYGVSSRGDLPRYEFSGVFGKKFDDGGFVFVGSYRESEGNLIIDRKISRNLNFMDRGGRNFRDQSSLLPSFIGIDPDNPNRRMILRDGVAQATSINDFRDYVFPDFPQTSYTIDDGINYWDYESSASDIQQLNLWFAGDHELGKGVKAYVEATYNNRQSFGFIGNRLAIGEITVSADNQYNPFGRDLRLYKTLANDQGLGGGSLNDVDSNFYRVVTGLEGSIGQNWTWNVAGNYQRLNQYSNNGNSVVPARLRNAVGSPQVCAAAPGCVPFNAFGGTGSITPEMLAYVTTPRYRDVQAELRGVDANLAGVLFNLPAGPVGLAVGAEYREESYRQLQDNAPDYATPTPPFLPPLRIVKEVYGELSVPILRDLPFVYSLDVEGAVRYSNYSAWGGTTNPKIAVKWRPVADLLVRGSFGTAFRAPNFTEANSTQSRSVRPVEDPCSGADFASFPVCKGQRSPVQISTTVISGGNPDLKPETADTWTAGFVWTPSSLPRFSLTADVFQIEKQNIIGTADVNYVVRQNALGLGNFRVTRDIDNKLFEVFVVRDNLLEQKINGVDATANYVTDDFSWGRLNLRANVTYLNSYKLSPAAGQAAVERAGTYSIALGTLAKWKFTTGATWTYGDWSVSYDNRFVDGVRNEASVLVNGRYMQADSYLQHDLLVSKELPQHQARVSVGVENVTDEMPPFIEGNYFNGFDQQTFNSRGRFFYMRVRKDF